MALRNALLLLTLLIAACTPTTANRGNMLDVERISSVKEGESTREDVATKLGSPTHVSTFDENTWYYIGRRTEQYSFLDPDLIKQQIIEVVFDENGIVKAVNALDPANAEDISPVARVTPTYGRTNTLLQDLLGGIGGPGLPNNMRDQR